MSIKYPWPTSGALLLVGNLAVENIPSKRSSLEQVAFDYAKKVLADGSDRDGVLFDAGTHLDFRYVVPESNSQWIKIDQIRELIQWAIVTPQLSSKKVAILSPAHAMNLQAANAFLKTLEEPSLSTLFILVTDRASLIPATIRSRCFWARIRTPFSEFNTYAELKTTIQNDLKKLKTGEIDLISVANEWLKHPPKTILHWLLIGVSESIHQFALENKINENNQPWKFIEKAFEAKRALDEPNPPNGQLLIESLLIQYLE